MNSSQVPRGGPDNKRLKLSAGAGSIDEYPKRWGKRPPQLTRSVRPTSSSVRNSKAVTW